MARVKAILHRAAPVFITAVVWAVYFVFLHTPTESERVLASIDCKFEALPDQAPIKLGSYTAPLARLELNGALTNPIDGGLHDFKGDAAYVIEGRSMSAEVRGSVFLDDKKKPAGVLLEIEDDNFGMGGLSILTLDDKGGLDFSRDRAFAFTDPNFKLAHPMSMDCHTSSPVPEWQTD